MPLRRAASPMCIMAAGRRCGREPGAMRLQWVDACARSSFLGRQCANLHGVDVGLHQTAEGVARRLVAVPRFDAAKCGRADGGVDMSEAGFPALVADMLVAIIADGDVIGVEFCAQGGADALDAITHLE